MVIELLTLKSRKASNVVKELSMVLNLVFTMPNELSMVLNLVFTMPNELSMVLNLVFTLVVVPLIFNIKFPLTLILVTLKSVI